jgi:hypothetical protein
VGEYEAALPLKVINHFLISTPYYKDNMAYPNTISKVLPSLIKRLWNSEIVPRIKHFTNMV